MSEQKILEMLKQDMIKTIESFDFENVVNHQALLKKQLHVLDELHAAYMYRREMQIILSSEVDSHVQEECIAETSISATQITDKPSLEISSSKQILENTPAFESEHNEADARPVYTFERKLRGGMVEEIDGFVPEGVVRRLHLEHGDKVYAVPKEMSDPSRKHFIYELAEKGAGEDAPERIQHNYCPVVKEAGVLVVDKSAETGEPIRFNEAQYSIVLDEHDLLEFNISEGDLIDVAYPKHKPDKAKILWKHSTEPTDRTKLMESLSSQPKVKKEPKCDEQSPEQTLDGRTVLVIGNEPKKNVYKHAIESRGGVFSWADAKFSLERLRPLVKKADVVCFLLRVSGHVGMEHIKQMCKDYNVPFETSWSNGQTSIVRMAEEAEVSA